MKKIIPVLVWLLASGASFAAVFKEAEVTRTINDVRVLPDQRPPFAAKPGQIINGKTSVATGVQSRAELRFPDKTITRLGANTTFRLEEGTRNIDLDRGVILLQVPKQMGGATVRTAAVTAAVTGTTLLVEYQPDGYIKIIVLEGSVDIFLKDDHSTFRTINAGDMLIMKPDSKIIPAPVQVDLERLQKTSKLLDPKEFAPLGNERHLRGALQGQDRQMKKGELHKTAFLIPGRGTRVNLPNEIRRELARFGIRDRDRRAPGPGGPGDGPGGPGGSGTPRAPRIPGTAVITTNTDIVTNPHISTAIQPYGLVDRAPGAFYQPNGGDGVFNQFFYRRDATFTEIDNLMRRQNRWAGFLFDDIYILGTPNIDSSPGSRHLVLAAVNKVTLTSSFGDFVDLGMWDLDAAGTPIDSLVIAAGKDGIFMQAGFSIVGSSQTLALYAPGNMADVSMVGDPYKLTVVDLQQGSFLAHAGRDVLIDGARIFTKATEIHADRDVVISKGADLASSSRMDISSQRSIMITSSSQLRRLASTDPSSLHLDARGGDLTITNSSLDAGDVFLESQGGDLTMIDSTITGDAIRARTLSPNGTLLLGGNSSLTAVNAIKLYAQGSNGQVRFAGPVTLSSPSTVIAGKTVTVDPGVSVNVTNAAGFKVYTDNAQFSNNVPNIYGDFRTGGGTFTVNQSPYSGRPGF